MIIIIIIIIVIIKFLSASSYPAHPRGPRALYIGKMSVLLTELCMYGLLPRDKEGGSGGGHTDPEIRGVVFKKNFFSLSGLSSREGAYRVLMTIGTISVIMPQVLFISFFLIINF